MIRKGDHSFIMLKQENVKNKSKDFLGDIMLNLTSRFMTFTSHSISFYNSLSKKFSTLSPIYVGVSRSKVMCVNA